MNTVEIEAFELHRLVLLLDASQEALDKAAAAEKRREAGKPLRQITEQQRAESARELVAEISGKYGIDLE